MSTSVADEADDDVDGVVVAVANAAVDDGVAVVDADAVALAGTVAAVVVAVELRASARVGTYDSDVFPSERAATRPYRRVP